MPLLFKRNTMFRTHSHHQGYLTITFEDTSHQEHASTQNTQTILCLPWISRVLQKIHQGFTEITKPLTLLKCQQVKFGWTPAGHEAFLRLKESIIHAPIL